MAVVSCVPSDVRIEAEGQSFAVRDVRLNYERTHMWSMPRRTVECVVQCNAAEFRPELLDFRCNEVARLVVPQGEYEMLFHAVSAEVIASDNGYFTVEYRLVGTPGELVVAPKNIRDIIASRIAPTFWRKRQGLPSPADIREERARGTLRRMVGDQAYRTFLAKGFVTARGKSGLSYQIFTGSQFTRVYRAGKWIETLCVVLKGKFPATDSLIMRYLLIVNDEELFRSTAIRQHVGSNDVRPQPAPDQRTLKEIFDEMRQAA